MDCDHEDESGRRDLLEIEFQCFESFCALSYESENFVHRVDFLIVNLLLEALVGSPVLENYHQSVIVRLVSIDDWNQVFEMALGKILYLVDNHQKVFLMVFIIWITSYSSTEDESLRNVE